jgi:hypothetical protein
MNYLRREKGTVNQNDVLTICSHDKKIREGERNVNMLGWINFNWVILFGFTNTIHKMDALKQEAADAAVAKSPATTTTTTTESTAESKKDK